MAVKGSIKDEVKKLAWNLSFANEEQKDDIRNYLETRDSFQQILQEIDWTSFGTFVERNPDRALQVFRATQVKQIMEELGLL